MADRVGAPELDLLITFALVLVGAEVGSLLFHAMRLPRILGMIAAGVVIGPNVNPYALSMGLQPERLTDLAFLGGIFLMFQIGLTFNVRNFRRVGVRPLVVALVADILSFLSGFLVAILMGQPTELALFVGLLLTPTSSILGIRLAQDQNLLATQGIDTTIAAIIYDDVTILFFATVVLAVAGGAGQDWTSVGAGLGLIILLTGIVIFIALKTVPRTLTIFERLSGGHPTLLAVSLMLLVSFVFTLIGLPPIFGAFWAGSILASGRYGERLQAFVQPVTELFAAVFFAAIGMLLDPSLLPLLGLLALAVIVVGAATKLLGGFLALRAYNVPVWPAAACGTVLIPRGEVSLVVAQYAGDAALVGRLQLLGTLIVIATTLVAPLSLAVVRILARRAAREASQAAAPS